MKSLRLNFTIVLLLCPFIPFGGNNTFAENRNIQVVANFTTTPPKIDGRMDDSVWELGVPIDGLFQRDPIEGAPASERTVVRILFDKHSLYIGFRCYDSSSKHIIANRMQRDSELEENDNVSVILDPYNDSRGGFFFSTNPLGAKLDILLSDEGRSRDEAWDCIWHCQTTRDSRGWTAEMAIPFDQLRYAESDDAIWGINLGRTIRRKNEDVYLVPPSRSYGFGGQFRTSNLAQLRGLGKLTKKHRLQITPYGLFGIEREFNSLNPDMHRLMNSGIDLKYGPTSSTTIDFSYKTDFSQVETDQEQTNLTRFSLFLPEKRDFFLEGASIFSFGERVERISAQRRPPNLLFYSRQIGIQSGFKVPILFGGKFTGKIGHYEVGALNVMTDPTTFGEEKIVQRFRTDTGTLLDVSNLASSSAVIVDTLEVELIDTVKVARTRYSVFRLRREVLNRSNFGMIFTSKSPGENSSYNRSLGADLNLSLLNATLSAKGFIAKTWTPGLDGKDFAGLADLEYRKRSLQIQLSFLDVKENFKTEIGFVPRKDVRRIKSSFRFRPYSKISWVRQFSIGPRFIYLMDQNNILRTSEFYSSVFVKLEKGDWIGVGYSDRFERLDEPFEIHENIIIPKADHRFGTLSFLVFSNRGRKISGNISYQIGNFFGGTRRRLSFESGVKASGRLSFKASTEFNKVKLPGGDFATYRLGNKVLYSFTPALFVRGVIQLNSKTEIVGGNFLLSYQFAPGSDFFFVYNHAWDTKSGLRQLNRSFQLKLSFFWKP
jgi:hypothetical protein